MTLLKPFVNVLPAFQSPDLGGSFIFEAGIKTNLNSVGIELDAEKAKKVVPELAVGFHAGWWVIGLKNRIYTSRPYLPDTLEYQ